MILFLILSLILIALIALTIIVLATGGTAFIVVFGDVIVCIFILAWIIKKIFFKKKDKKEASFADDLKKGWKAVACNKGLLTLVVMAALMTFCMGAV